MPALTSSLIVRLIDRVTGPAKEVTGSLRGISRAATGSGKTFADKMTNAQARVASAMAANRKALDASRMKLFDAVAGYYALDKTIGSSVRAAGKFQRSMNQVAAVSGATGDQFSQLRQQALKLGRTTQFTASQSADAMNFLAMAGFKANDIIGAMPGTLQLAASAQLDLGQSADIVSNVLTGYGKDVKDLGHVNDVLVKAFTSANTNLVQLGEAMKYAGPVASSAGVKFEETTAALALMGNAGIQASMAGTSLRGALTRVLNPSTKIANAMDKAGLKFTDAKGRLIPLADIIQQLEPHAEDTGLMMELFGQRAGPAMAALVSQGSDSLRKMTKELENSGGTAKKIADVQMQGFNGQMLRFKSAVEGLQIAVGNALLPALTKLVDALTALIGPITTLINQHPHLTAAVLGTASAFIALRVAMAALSFAGLLGKGGLIEVTGWMVRFGSRVGVAATETVRMQKALAVMGGRKYGGLAKAIDFFKAAVWAVPGIGAIGSALSAVGAALATISAPVWGGIAVGVAAVAGAGLMLWKYWDRISSVMSGVARRIGEELQPAMVALQPVLQPVADAASKLGEAFAVAKQKISQFVNWIGSFFNREVLTGAQKQQFNQTGYDIADAMINSIKQRFAELIEWFKGLPQRILDAVGNIDLGKVIHMPSVNPGAALSNLFGGGDQQSAHRAGGGPVWPGSSFLVGENQPEIFTPRTAGTITPLSKAQGATVNIGDIIIQGASDPEETARRVLVRLRQEIEMIFRGSHADMETR